MFVEEHEFFRYRFIPQLRQVLLTTQKISAQGYLFTLTPARKNTVIPDPDKSLGEYMQKKARQECFARDSHRFIFATVTIILGVEGDILIIHTDDAAVAYGNPVSVLAEIFEDFMCPGKSLFGLDDPVGIIQ